MLCCVSGFDVVHLDPTSHRTGQCRAVFREKLLIIWMLSFWIQQGYGTGQYHAAPKEKLFVWVLSVRTQQVFEQVYLKEALTFFYVQQVI